MKKSKAPIRILLSLIGLFLATSLKAQTLPGADGVFCPGATVSITAAHDAAAVSYVWKRYAGKDLTDPAPTTISGQNGATMSDALPTTPGYYTYVSIAVNIGGCESTPSEPKTVYVLPGITAGITSTYSNNIICVSQSTTGTLTANPGTVQSVPETFASTDYSYQWKKDGVNISGANSSTYTLTPTELATVGDHDYTVTINYKDHSCTDATATPVTLKVVPLAGKPVITIN